LVGDLMVRDWSVFSRESLGGSAAWRDLVRREVAREAARNWRRVGMRTPWMFEDRTSNIQHPTFNVQVKSKTTSLGGAHFTSALTPALSRRERE
jgi:hypothetical protein